jgi:hypothetical protein
VLVFLRDRGKPRLTHLRERAGITERLASAAGKVFEWNTEHGNPLILVGMVEQMDPENEHPAIETEIVNPQVR